MHQFNQQVKSIQLPYKPPAVTTTIPMISNRLNDKIEESNNLDAANDNIRAAYPVSTMMFPYQVQNMITENSLKMAMKLFCERGVFDS